MTDMHDDYLDKAATRVLGYAAGYGDEHDLWVAEVSKRARRYRQAQDAASQQHHWCLHNLAPMAIRTEEAADRAYLWAAKAEAMEALLRWAES